MRERERKREKEREKKLTETRGHIHTGYGEVGPVMSKIVKLSGGMGLELSWLFLIKTLFDRLPAPPNPQSDHFSSKIEKIEKNEKIEKIENFEKNISLKILKKCSFLQPEAFFENFEKLRKLRILRIF